MNDDLQKSIDSALGRKVAMPDIAQYLSTHENPEFSAYGKSWIESQNAGKTLRSDYEEPTFLSKAQKFAEENPITTAAAATVGTGLLGAGVYVAKEKFKTREEIRKAREIAKIESPAVKIQRDQLTLGEQKLDLDRQKFQAQQDALIKSETSNAVNAGKMNSYSVEKHGYPLASLEEFSNGPLKSKTDIDLVAGQYKRNFSPLASPISGTVSNQPAGVPNGVSPISQLTTQPPVPQQIQPKPVAGSVAPMSQVEGQFDPARIGQPLQDPLAGRGYQTPVQDIGPRVPSSVTETLAAGGTPTQIANQSAAQAIDEVAPEPARATPAKKIKGAKPPVETELRPGYEFRPNFGTSDTYLVDTLGPKKYKIARMELNDGQPFGKYNENLVKDVMNKYRVGERITKEAAKAAGAGAMSSPGGVPSKSIQRGLQIGGVLGMGLPAWLAARASELPGFDEAMARANEAVPGMGTSANAMPFSRGEEMSKMGNAYVTAGNPNYRAELQQQIAVEQDPKRLNQLIGELQKTGAVGAGRGIAPPSAYKR